MKALNKTNIILFLLGLGAAYYSIDAAKLMMELFNYFGIIELFTWN